MSAMRVPSALVICGGTLFFLLYLLPWHSLPSTNIPVPSPSSQKYRDVFLNPEEPRNEPVIGAGASVELSEIEPVAYRFKAAVPGIIPYQAILESSATFNASQADVMVLLHIQKTGGTSFEKHIVQDLQIQRPCVCWKRKKRCKCNRPLPASTSDVNQGEAKANSDTWLFSRFSTGWACGLHADWTELVACVNSELDKSRGTTVTRRYFYLTMIREPIHRFLSEFRHVERGATWKASRHSCDGRLATAEELGSCYTGRSWTGVSLTEFLSCPHNLAFNRQTRMLADLSLIGCYNKSYMSEEERDRVMLASAKHNLESMAFVGLTENQRMSQYVFEETFGLRFKSPFTQNEDTYSSTTLDKATPEELQIIREVNSLDLQLYTFAEQLLRSRFEQLKSLDKDFEDHYNYLGEEKGRHFSWDELENEV